MKEIQLSKGKIALVDDEDYDLVSKYKWYCNNGRHTYYACRDDTMDGSKILMHRFILGAIPGSIVDHIDGNGWNNCKNNLRVCTSKENARNMKRYAESSSKYRGVSWDSINKKWYVQITVDYKSYFLGRFTDEVEAAKVYDKAALEYFKEFASLNFTYA